MKNKVKETDMDNVVSENLEKMDRLLETRKVNVSESEAVKSEEALIAYINQSPCGKWIINHYAHLSTNDRLAFIKGINTVLPHVADTENFVSHIKFCVKQNMCSTIDFDCWVHDYMAVSSSECILTDEGYHVIKQKYQKQINALLEDMRIQHEKEELEDEQRYQEYIKSQSHDAGTEYILEENEELPFM